MLSEQKARYVPYELYNMLFFYFKKCGTKQQTKSIEEDGLWLYTIATHVVSRRPLVEAHDCSDEHDYQDERQRC